jgi:D(-)-tartrate dehydratase
MDRTGTPQRDGPRPVSVYAGGGYYYPSDDIARLSDEVRCFRDLGHRRAKIKIGSAPLAQDLKRIDAAARLLDSPGH